ncbi:hypothetical protein MSG28_014439 [Choristoneura fumiferana]|uniref:Uncharacterized protein n=1 Tax=Choristoneura fumiferana TaxID=7141 RepID=A0ACC0JRF4_CHOFU|nr:hypothetical protein MSG28_014439 [Choristoneura fumiferana]
MVVAIRADLAQGDACEAEGKTVGTCETINKCPFAYKQLQNYKKPKMCKWMDKTRIVCCPRGNPVWEVGELRAFFGGTQKGMLQGRDMTCRYNGEMPALCCDNTKDVEPPPEPKQCPPLPTVTSKADDIAFKKCLEYRRYVSPCVADESQDDKLVRADGCGINQFGDRISDGTPAEPKEFPHMALLGCRNDYNTGIPPLQWVAGGSLISDKFILTAAHVLSHPDYGAIRYALLGVNNKTRARDGFLYNIVNVIAHKFYEKDKKPHDIALLELHRRVTLSEFIRPACLPTSGLEVMDSNRILAGWGGTLSATSSEELLKVYIAELDYETDCKSRFPDNVKKVFLKDSMLCAGTVNEDRADSCRGDSGGPLMALARDLHCTYIVRGVVSFGPGCGSGLPGIYTDVRAYLPWIVENVWRK